MKSLIKWNWKFQFYKLGFSATCTMMLYFDYLKLISFKKRNKRENIKIKKVINSKIFNLNDIWSLKL